MSFLFKGVDFFPHDTRWKIIRALEMLQGKTDRLPAKKHGNIPL